LADFSFTNFITLKLIKFLYILGLLIGALGGLVGLLAAFSQGVLAGIGGLIVVPLILLLFAMYLRVGLELLAVIFRIAENTAEMARRSTNP
jgi:hypothetical protein